MHQYSWESRPRGPASRRPVTNTRPDPPICPALHDLLNSELSTLIGVEDMVYEHQRHCSRCAGLTVRT